MVNDFEDKAEDSTAISYKMHILRHANLTNGKNKMTLVWNSFQFTTTEPKLNNPIPITEAFFPT